MPVLSGDAPDFTLPAWTPSGRTVLTLSEQRGRPVVLALYPGDDTLTCTKQLCSYRDDLSRLEALGAVLWAISPQDVDSHERFAAKRGLTFPLLADVDRSVHRAYGAALPLGRTKRGVVVVDAEGRVAWSHVSLGLLTFDDVDTISEVLARLDRPTP